MQRLKSINYPRRGNDAGQLLGEVIVGPRGMAPPPRLCGGRGRGLPWDTRALILELELCRPVSAGNMGKEHETIAAALFKCSLFSYRRTP